MARNNRTALLALLLICFVFAVALVLLWPSQRDTDITGSIAGKSGRPGQMARLEPGGFDRLPGWARDDQAEALGALLRSCAFLTGQKQAWSGWPSLCAAAQQAANAGGGAARAFFEQNFTPHQIVSKDGKAGFLTSYYEPEADGSRTPDNHFSVPIYRRPGDLVTLKPGDERGALPRDFSAARRTASGLAPYPARADIEQGALKGQGLELVYLHDPVEVFFIHVQGSSRIRLTDGSLMRLAFDGKNGHPYTSIAKVLIEQEGIARENMTADRLRAWLNRNPEQARQVMWRNSSFIFFREARIDDPALGPIGAQGAHLTAGRSLAVDRAFHELGLPFYIDARLPERDGRLVPFRRLMIAQDTGSAIIGAARGDIFWGSGDEAGFRAGLVRHPGDFHVLLPNGYPLPGWAVRPGA